MLWITSRRCEGLAPPLGRGQSKTLLQALGKALPRQLVRCCMQRRAVIIGLLARLGARGLLQQTRRLRPLRPLQQLQSR